MAPVVTGLKPVPLNVTVFEVVNEAPGAETVLEPEYVTALVGQNFTATLLPLPLDNEKLAPDVILKGELGLETVPETGDVPETSWIENVAGLQVPTWMLPKFSVVGPTVSWGGM